MWLLRTSWRCALIGLCFTAAHAAELRQIAFKVGTEGLQPAPIRIRNAGPQAIACVAEFAHWYSRDIGSAQAGAAVDAALWFETRSGTFVMLNAKQENLPVEKLWCGIAGKAYATRSVLPLRRSAGDMVSARTVTCATGAGLAVCE